MAPTKASDLNLKSSLNNHIFIFKSAGLWKPEEGSDFKKNLYTVYTVFVSALLFYPYLFSQVIQGCMVMDDLEQVTESTMVPMSICTVIGKLLSIQLKQQRIQKLIGQLNSDMFAPKLPEHRSILLRATDQVKFLFFALQSSYGCTVIFMSIFPLLDASKKRSLPFNAWFPFSLEDSPAYELMYVHQVLGTAFTAALNSGLDTFIVSLIIHAVAQLDILLSNLSTGPSSNWQDADPAVRDSMVFLKRCVEHHQMIIDFVTEIESLFNFSILIQFAMSCLILCMTMFQMTVMQPFTVQFASIIEYQVCMMAELFLYCWFGNELYLRSTMISEAAYFSDWYERGAIYRQSLQIIMVRATMPIQIRAGYFFALDLQTFTTILRAAWSTFALLQQVHTEIGE